ncbi:hypothetical protein H6S82_21290 [Planktothrix sp. FACHB-1355]|uniref:Uncharacterized protein n=1 Tax=Aerosakkonema funiforme FACHB-1375 TaxID=2949571 RepID=A0A926VE54_9CYAN|nr:MULTISPECIES: hypothetical protein [Oscillatoriales]MBD2182276.1 hypothetical protein [Aerosakkonema funiforme FACHB-1375]MBD3561355.1 hypothetical protein [Planktothrix sp. FACHB-1355]
MSSLPKLGKNKFSSRRNLWFERLMAILASLNLGLVLFDMSYVPWRNFWLQGNLQFLDFVIKIPLPPITHWYDPVKGIQPHRETQKYLETVNALEEQVAQQGLQSPETEKLLADMRRLSNEMIDSDPFRVANKSGTLEKIKNRMRDRIGLDSARQSFKTFWSQDYLLKNGWKKEITFFNNKIRPSIETNYFRPIAESGEFVDKFWILDIPFAIIFGLEFLGRTWSIGRRHFGVSWRDAMLWRWYDIFLLIPFWRWLRIIPVTLRLHQAELIDLDRIQAQFSQGFVATFAEEITEVVVVRVIKQVQSSIEKGEITRWLLQPEKRTYIDINNVNEVEAIADIMIKLIVYRVLPKIQPDLEAILRHNIESVLKNLPAYKNIQNIPLLANIPNQLTERLVTEISQGAYEAIKAALEDAEGAKLSAQLVQHFGEAIAQEVQSQQTVDKIQSLVLDMLEEIKINYVERLSQEDVEQVMEETRKIRQLTQTQDGQIYPYKKHSI